MSCSDLSACVRRREPCDDAPEGADGAHQDAAHERAQDGVWSGGDAAGRQPVS